MPSDNPLTQRIVVIGAGQAGLSICDRLRQEGHTGPITLVGAEHSPPYQRPPLSKAYLAGALDAERLLLKPEDYYRTADIELALNDPATELDRESCTVRLASGMPLPYDRLAIATGAIPRRLPESIGGELPGVLVLRTKDDADTIQLHLQESKLVKIVGGGYIGLEIAACARKLGADVEIIEATPRVLARVAGAETAKRMTDIHRAHGVNFLLNANLKNIERHGSDQLGVHVTAKNEDSDRIIVYGVGAPPFMDNVTAASSDGLADIVVVGIGAEPDIALAQAAGLEIDNGIRVNEFCQTSDPNVFAAGDCTSFPYQGGYVRLESVQNAIDQGEFVARNMLGQQVPYRPVPWFWSDQYDTRLQIAGLWQNANRTVLRPGANESACSIWYFRDETLLATDAINDPRACMICRRLLEQGKSPDPEAIADPKTNLKSLL